jgi:hypothetical protein
MSVKYSFGIPPKTRHEMRRREEAMGHDIVIVASPATLTSAATLATPAARTVTLTVKNAAGEFHDWLNGTITGAVSIADTSAASTATASISTTSVTFIDGYATVTVSASGGTWASGSTNTLSFHPTILGFSPTTVTSVETFASTT